MLIITEATINAFASFLAEREYAAATISKYAHDVCLLMDYAPDGIPDRAVIVGFRVYLDAKSYSPASVNSMLGAVNLFLTFLGLDWRLKYVRVQRKTFLPADKELTQTEYERMVRAAENDGNERLALLVQALCALGIWVSELHAVTVESLKTGEAHKVGTYVIVSAEADVVRRIYRQYLEGYSPKMIADGLMEDGICTPSGGEKWYPSTVASILENEKYAGDLLMQKWYVEDYLTHRCVKNSGEKPQYFVEDDHDPIVPKAVFYQVQGEKRPEPAVITTTSSAARSTRCRRECWMKTGGWRLSTTTWSFATWTGWS